MLKKCGRVTIYKQILRSSILLWCQKGSRSYPMSDNSLNNVQHLSRLTEHQAPVTFRLEIIQQGNQEDHFPWFLCEHPVRRTQAFWLGGKWWSILVSGWVQLNEPKWTKQIRNTLRTFAQQKETKISFFKVCFSLSSGSTNIEQTHLKLCFLE